jgi:hypothetical protein
MAAGMTYNKRIFKCFYELFTVNLRKVIVTCTKAFRISKESTFGTWEYHFYRRGLAMTPRQKIMTTEEVQAFDIIFYFPYHY